MRGLIRFAVFGAAVVLFFILSFFFLTRTEPETVMTGGVVFSSGEPTDVKSVSVRNESGEFAFLYDDDEEGYIIDDIPPHIVNIEAFINFLAKCAQLAASRHIPPEEAEPFTWGLGTPSAEVEILFFNGEQLRLRIGDKEPISGYFYASVEGHDGVFLFSRTAVEQFLLPKTQVISMLFTPPLTLSSPLSAIRDITFTGGELETPVTIFSTAEASDEVTQAAMSFGAATHIVHGAATYMLDQTYGITILGSLFGIIANDIVGFNLSEAEVSALGFDQPYMSVDYYMWGGDDAGFIRVRLRIVRTNDGRYLAMHAGRGVVFEINREAFLDIEYEKLLLRWFLTPFIADLSAVTIKSSDLSYRFEIDNSGAGDPVVRYEGQILDIDLFRAFFRLITSAAHDGNYLGALYPPRGEEAMLTIIYEYLAPGKSNDVLSLHPGDVRRLLVFINGSGEFAIKDLFAERVLEGSENLIAGRPIEEAW